MTRKTQMLRTRVTTRYGNHYYGLGLEKPELPSCLVPTSHATSGGPALSVYEADKDGVL